MIEIWDGFTSVQGVDASTPPQSVSNRLLSGAVNRSFRSGRNSTRPPFKSRKLVFDTPENEEVFRSGGIHGVFGFRASRSNAVPWLLIGVRDRVLKCRMVGDTIRVYGLKTGMTANIRRSFFCQTVDRVYFQNGFDRPFGWDGSSEPYELPDGNEGMPIGTQMVFIQGRLAVLTPDNYIIISDHIYGHGLKDTKGVEVFSEKNNFNDIGAIASPADLGSIGAMVPIVRFSDINGQGDLLVLCQKGAFTLSLSAARNTWLTSGIQRIVMTGRGCGSPNAAIPVNSDIWYQSTDGTIASYKTMRSVQSDDQGDISLSEEVAPYLRTDPARLEYVSGAFFANRLLMTTGITLEAAKGGGFHRYGHGMVVLDLHRGSLTRSTPPSWSGLWTGPRVVQFAQIIDGNLLRNLAVAYDADGQNRIYELGGTGPDEADDGKQKIIGWRMDTPAYFFQSSTSEKSLGAKRLDKVIVQMSAIPSPVMIKSSYRPLGFQGWFPTKEEVEAGSSAFPEGGTMKFLTKGESRDRITFAIPEACETGQKGQPNKSDAFQVRVEGEGEVEIDSVRAGGMVVEEKQKDSQTCNDENRVKRLAKPLIITPDEYFPFKIYG